MRISALAEIFRRNDQSEPQTSPSSLRATCTKPFDQRRCCTRQWPKLIRDETGHGGLHQKYAMPTGKFRTNHQIEIFA